MDVQNDTEVEIEFQVQPRPPGIPDRIDLEPGKTKRIDVGEKPVTVNFFSKLTQNKILEVVRHVRPDQAVHLVSQGVLVNEHGPLERVPSAEGGD